MTTMGLLQLGVYLLVLIALVRPLGAYMARVYEAKPLPGLDTVLGPLERLIYRLCGVRASDEMNWKSYAMALMLFNVLGLLMVYWIQRVQGILPLNPAHLPAVAPDLAFNTAVSFASNTNWQSYGGETTLSHLTQMLGLTVQNFVSAATGMAVLVALIRGFVRRQASSIGNFWVDLTRTTLYILIPLSLVLALLFVSQGVVQTFAAYRTIDLLQPSGETTTQTLALGPAASQIAIKQLGTNGGGFFNVNSAHPFENPTPLSNFLECLAILLIPAALCYTFGTMVGDTRQGWAILAAMIVIFVPLLFLCYGSEEAGNPALSTLGVTGGNMEGKEVRFGIATSALWASATTAASNGSVNSMHDSYTALGGLVPMWLMQLGEVVFGGVGSGLYGMLVFAIIAVFVAGLMVGRTPEVSRQEDRSIRDEDGVAVHPHPAVSGEDRHGHRGEREQRRHVADPGPRAAWVQRSALLGQLDREQQRLGVRRAGNEQSPLQHRRRNPDARGEVLADHPGAGNRRLTGGQAARAAVQRHAADAYAAVCHAARRRGDHRGCAGVYPRAGAGAGGRAIGDALNEIEGETTCR